MPNPKKYKSKKKWMKACMHQVYKVEGKSHDQSVAQCLNMWERKKKAELQTLVKLADELDKKGLAKEAETIDEMIEECFK